MIEDPKALKIDATCAPVAPAPITTSDFGTAFKVNAAAGVTVSAVPGTSIVTAHAAGADDDSLAATTEPSALRYAMRIGEPHVSRVFEKGNACSAYLLQKRGVIPRLVDDFGGARGELRVIERRRAYRDTVTRQLFCLAHEPRRVGKTCERGSAPRWRPFLQRLRE